jgi:hypothetical protein
MGVSLAIFNVLAAIVTASSPPQFIPSATSAHRVGDVVTISFTEVGLSPGAADTVTATVTSSITRTCSGSTATSTGQTANSAVLTANSTGQLIGSITVNSPIATVSIPGCTLGEPTLDARVTDLGSGATLDVAVVDR